MSALEYAGTGVAIEDIKPDAKILKIYLLDVLDTEGVLGNETSASIVVSDGQSKKKVLVSKEVDYIEALWEGADNTITAPTIHKGEQVEVIRYANQDQFFWRKSRGFESDIRGREVKVFGVSTVDRSNPANLGKSATKENMYYIRMDSINGIIELITNDDNGEAATYHLKIDLMKGEFSLVDNKENSIVLKSVEGDIQVNAKSRIGLKAPTIEVDCDDLNIKAKKTDFQSKKTVFTGDTFENKVPVNKITGALTVTKGVDFKATLDVMSACTINGPTTLNGPISGLGGVFKLPVKFVTATW